MKTIDMHCDTILKLMENREASNLYKNNFNVDIRKLQKANSLVQFFALWIDFRLERNPMDWCLDMIDKFYIELGKNSEHMGLARNYDEVMANHGQGKISAILTIEDGLALGGKIYNLRNYYRLGVRSLTLTWNGVNELGYPNYAWKYKEEGLTEFGQEVVEEMNKLGMLIDVSHLSDRGFYDVANLSSKPFLASHSNARFIKNHPRNLEDNMIRVLAEKGGLMGINFERSFLGESKIARIDDMVRHIKHIRKVGGIDVIALGTDFDGSYPNYEIKDIGEIDKLAQALEIAGFTYGDIEKIFYKNALRIIREVL